MTYQEAENYIYSFSNLNSGMQVKTKNQCKLNLKKVSFFLELLGNPQNKIPYYIHITGTSGKGSLVSFVREIIVSSGERVGSVVSPHPSHIFERWNYNGKTMAPGEFVSIVSEIKPAIDRFLELGKYEMLSFFELCHIIGIYYLAQKNVKWAVIEVGCGGRYDASNVIPHKKLAIITNIGLDHTEILGNTKEKIAYEKAGIIKKECLVFTGEKKETCLDIFKKECAKEKANLYIIVPNYKIIKKDFFETVFEYKGNNYKIKLIGDHQIANAILAIESMQALGFSDKAIKDGLKKASSPLSMEIVKKNPIIILDGAHNEDKIRSSVNTIKSRFKNKKIDIVVGFSANKKTKQMIKNLSELDLGKVAISRNTINHFRKVADLEIVKNEFEKYSKNIKTKIFSNPLDAFFWIMNNNKNNIKLVTGSVFLSGEVRGFLKKTKKIATFRK